MTGWRFHSVPGPPSERSSPREDETPISVRLSVVAIFSNSVASSGLTRAQPALSFY